MMVLDSAWTFERFIALPYSEELDTTYREEPLPSKPGRAELYDDFCSPLVKHDLSIAIMPLTSNLKQRRNTAPGYRVRLLASCTKYATISHSSSFMSYDLQVFWDADIAAVGSLVRGQITIRDCYRYALPLSFHLRSISGSLCRAEAILVTYPMRRRQ